ncbi:GGDEF domain-containing protein [Treponema sp. R80B11-R83G3]
MKIFFGGIYSLVDKLKQIRLKKVLAVVPSEMKEQFDQMQMKNNLHSLKILGAIGIIFNTLNLLLLTNRADEISQILWSKLFFTDLCHLSIMLLFCLLTGYFSKKEKHPMLWFICYLFILLHFFLSLYFLLSVYTVVDVFLVLQVFFTSAFLYTFVPDFKPKIFISFLVLWYFALIGLFAYENHSFGGLQIFVLNIFLIALIIRILYYNYKVKTFINIFRISALNEKLIALSMTDELTKLNNRRSFLEYMDTIWTISRRLITPVNVLMIDVDYFKKYNDSMGHLEGDKALVAIAKCLKDQIKRDSDFVARFGGEEFVCLLPFLEKEDALNVAKNLVQKIENMEIPHPKSEISKYITVSIGMANIIPDDHNSQTQLLDDADKALYKAKEYGRNMVTTW